jgi:cell division protein FtsI (penicillin-binding protein 3)
MSAEEKSRTAAILARELELDEEWVETRLNRDKAFIWIKRKVQSKIADRLKRLDLKGVYFLDESKRKYPNDSLASHIIGFAGMDNKGLEGIERDQDRFLKGSPGWRHIVRDAKRRTVLFNEESSIPAMNGNNLILTIDAVIQYIVEDELAKMSRKFNVSGASCIVMDPYTGKILAMANYPGYDLNKYYLAPRDIMKNISISNIYEPGSVFKIITASAALNEGIIGLDEEIFCENGECRLGGRILHDYHAYGDLSFEDVIVNSSNIGTVKVAQVLGEEKLFKYIQEFGFGHKTGIDISGEVSGISRPPSTWSKSDITTIPIGQGIAVTALQLVRAMSVIANGGYLMRPYLIEAVTSHEGEILKEFNPQNEGVVIQTDVCEKLRKVLKKVIAEGTGRYAKSKIYDLCGKTGTAQMVNPEGGYFENKYNASFLGFGPAEFPKICIVVTAFDPHPVHFGGVVAGPAFRNIAERTLKYLSSMTEEKETVSGVR